MKEFDQQEDGNYFSSDSLREDYVLPEGTDFTAWYESLRQANAYASQYIANNLTTGTENEQI